MKQVWFSGVHSSVGGGEKHYGLPNITLAWMMQQIKTHTALECDTSYAKDIVAKLDECIYNDKWGHSPCIESFKGWFRLFGRKERKPGLYSQGEKKTKESVHHSVRVRLGEEAVDKWGLIIEEMGPIECEFKSRYREM
jgi:hypothetical protein